MTFLVVYNYWEALERDVFKPRTATGSDLLCYLTCLYTITFVLLSRYLFTSKDDQLGNLGETIVLVCEMLTSGFSQWIKNVETAENVREVKML